MFKKALIAAVVLAAGLMITRTILAGSPCESSDSPTTVRGHCDRDGTVVGHYTSLYAYDASGAYYWDLGDGRVYTTPGISSPDDLDQATLSVCDYVNNYRGDFGGDPFLDSGWIQNHINCSGYDGQASYNYLIVHESDPRFREENADPGWGPDWRYSVLTVPGFGNIARPDHAVGVE